MKTGNMTEIELLELKIEEVEAEMNEMELSYAHEGSNEYNNYCMDLYELNKEIERLKVKGKI